MKIKILDKLDMAIFKHANPKHEAIAGTIFVHALIGGTIISLIVFVLQMSNISDKVVEIITGIGLLGLAGWVIKYALPTIKAFSGWGGRIMYVIFLLILSNLAFTIAMWMVIIALAGLVIYGIFKVFFGSGGSSGKAKGHEQEKPEDEYDATVIDENGYERKLKDHGFGTYKDDKGDYWKKSGDGTVIRDNS